ncbi:hypothetical protein [Mucilaginibacter arboris]|uniref:Uncharacterized protein n=1 Tax=Mucilaginibacter arboris TaxID=2682090 RepID=A0A7K1ST93_9SPHI|nr:hypothetical protein [Mucilaginibacter arboris]MVN20521.1 hypothetical protein [Mucilaginibacter arboris]
MAANFAGANLQLLGADLQSGTFEFEICDLVFKILFIKTSILKSQAQKTMVKEAFNLNRLKICSSKDGVTNPDQ